MGLDRQPFDVRGAASSPKGLRRAPRKGVAFPHISMNEDRLQLTAAGITTAKLRLNLPMWLPAPA